MSQYYYRIFGVNFGPVSLELLQHEIASGQLLGGHEVRAEGETCWTRVADFVGQLSTENQSVIKSTEAKSQWYVRMGHVEHGPIQFEKLIEMAKAGRILPMDFVRQSDQSGWTKAQAIPALFSSSSDQSGSTFSLKSVRPTLAVPQSFTQKAYSAHVVPIPPVLLAPRQDSTHSGRTSSSPSKHFNVSQPAGPVVSAPLQVIAPQSLVGSSDRPTVSSQQANLIPPQGPQSEQATERNVGTNQSAAQAMNDSPPKIKGESKHKLRRGQFKEPQLIDGKNLIMAAGVVLSLLFAWRSLMEASVGDLEEPYSELGGIYRTLDEKRSENPTMELWAFARKETVYKIESVKQKIRNLNSKHPVRNILLSFGDSLVAAAKSETHDEVAMHMQDAFKSLIKSSQEFRKWKDEEFQKELQRKKRTMTITKTPEQQ